ncbi:cobalamin biosynthesis protein CbiL [Poseidonocella sp. HB161398]|uniref:cobalamin biosynthesis protein CbiL n=1 Tax=Poseidonocella sp. HB161398 TaxID=2320855 RepID=UPI0011080F91|nr:cobalamin biosynthesis protein CbiL [Poseidonocella sp. HB161398]
MIRALLALAAALWLAGPAAAHSLRVFAKVEGAEVSGYGFFVGGGRPRGAAWSAEMAGAEIAAGTTGTDGSFAFALPDPVTGALRITVNSGEGHIAFAELPPERFAPGQLAPGAAAAAPATAPPPVPAAQGGLTEAMVEAAVERQVAPLLERIEQMDARMRLTDRISAVCLLFGIAGIALWARGRRT